MPQVYTGKVVIPGDQIDAYLDALQEAEAVRAPFRSQLTGLNTEFGNYLATKYSKRTVAKHTGIVALFIDFLCDYIFPDIPCLEDVRVPPCDASRPRVREAAWVCVCGSRLPSTPDGRC